MDKATIIRNLLAAGIPYEIIHEEAKSLENDDETDTNEPDHLDLLDDNLDMVYDDDVDYEPIESDSEDSYASAEGEEDSYEEDSDDETRSEQVNMD